MIWEQIFFTLLRPLLERIVGYIILRWFCAFPHCPTPSFEHTLSYWLKFIRNHNFVGPTSYLMIFYKFQPTRESVQKSVLLALLI